MPYTMTPAADPMAIAEREYGHAAEIKFTPFDSCIGIIGKVSGQAEVLGVHLVLRDNGIPGTPIGLNDVPAILQAVTSMNLEAGTAKIIGQTSVWEASAGPVYEAIKAGLANEYPLAKGTYGAKLDNDEVEITY